MSYAWRFPQAYEGRTPKQIRLDILALCPHMLGRKRPSYAQAGCFVHRSSVWRLATRGQILRPDVQALTVKQERASEIDRQCRRSARAVQPRRRWFGCAVREAARELLYKKQGKTPSAPVRAVHAPNLERFSRFDAASACRPADSLAAVRSGVGIRRLSRLDRPPLRHQPYPLSSARCSSCSPRAVSMPRLAPSLRQ
jgi:hypothetical protein